MKDRFAQHKEQFQARRAAYLQDQAALEQAAKAPLMRNWVEIDLDQAQANVAALKARLQADCKIMAVVKSNAYGHGLLQCASAFVAGGASALAVCDLNEALCLRRANFKEEILIFSEAEQTDYHNLVKSDISVSLFSISAIAKLQKAARFLSKQARFHLKLDTGMSRIGFDCRLLLSAIASGLLELPEYQDKEHFANYKNYMQQLVQLGILDTHLSLDYVAKSKREWQSLLALFQDANLLCGGVFTHLAQADAADPDEAHTSAEAQYLLFMAFTELLQAFNFAIGLRHISNSAATLRFPEYHLDMVRPGSLLYGLPPAGMAKETYAFTKPILNWYARFDRIYSLPAQREVSYGALWKSEKHTLCGVIAVGYADGLKRSLSNKLSLLLPGGELAEQRGRICMDWTMLELPEFYAKYTNDDLLTMPPVKLLGNGLGGELTAETMADLADSFDLEITCSIAPRVARVYRRKDEIVELAGYNFAAGKL